MKLRNKNDLKKTLKYNCDLCSGVSVEEVRGVSFRKGKDFQELPQGPLNAAARGRVG